MIGEVETISVLMPSSSSVANAFAATPGWLRIPAPMMLTCPRSSRLDHSHAQPVEHRVGLAAVGRGEHDLVAGLDDGVDVHVRVGERLEEPRRAHALDAVDRLFPAVGDA